MFEQCSNILCCPTCTSAAVFVLYLRSPHDDPSRDATDSDRALGGRRIDDTTVLNDLDVARRDQPPRCHPCRLQQVAPGRFGLGAADRFGSLGRTNRLADPAPFEELIDGQPELPIDRPNFALSTQVRAIPNLVPVSLPLLPPLNGPPTRNTSLWIQSHKGESRTPSSNPPIRPRSSLLGRR